MILKDNIFIAFDSRKLELNIAKLIIGGGFNVVGAAKDIMDLKRTIDYYKGGILITGYKFCGMLLDDLLEDIPDDISVIMIAGHKQLDTCESERVFKLAVPLQKNDLICSIEMFIHVDSNDKIRSVKTIDDERLVDKAKKVLIDRYLMNEEQAHRYIQKKSMDTGKKMVDIAKIIVSL